MGLILTKEGQDVNIFVKLSLDVAIFAVLLTSP